MTRPTLAVSTGPLWRLDVERAFEVVKAAGAEGVEVMVTQSPETQSANELERLARAPRPPDRRGARAAAAPHARRLLDEPAREDPPDGRAVQGARRPDDRPAPAVPLAAALRDVADPRARGLPPRGRSADHDGEHVPRARRDAGACASTGSDISTASSGSSTSRSTRPTSPSRRRTSSRRTGASPTASSTSTSRTTAARDATRTRRSARASFPSRTSSAPWTARRCDRSRSRSSPAPRRRPPHELERLFGESLDLVRKNLPTSASAPNRRRRTCDRSRRTRPRLAALPLSAWTRYEALARTSLFGGPRRTGPQGDRRAHGATQVPQGQRAVRPGRERRAVLRDRLRAR